MRGGDRHLKAPFSVRPAELSGSCDGRIIDLMEWRQRRLGLVWLSIYAIFLVTTPFEHHDLLCELKTPLHCRACTSSPVGSDPVRPTSPGASTLIDLGVAVPLEVATHGIVLPPRSTGRSPPASL
jgi:hypothetical protein